MACFSYPGKAILTSKLPSCSSTLAAGTNCDLLSASVSIKKDFKNGFDKIGLSNKVLLWCFKVIIKFIVFLTLANDLPTLKISHFVLILNPEAKNNATMSNY
jgi:hypothetical protein